MEHYDANQLQERLAEGVTPLQTLSGQGGVIAATMAELGVQAPTPQPVPDIAPAAADTGWNPILKGHGL